MFEGRREMRRIGMTVGIVVCLIGGLFLADGLRAARTEDAKEEKKPAEVKEEKKPAEVKEEKKASERKILDSKKEAAKRAAKMAKKEKKKVVVSETVETKQVSGEVMSLTPRKEPKSIVVAPKKGNVDYHFALAEDVQVVNRKLITDIKRGDAVTVVYEEKVMTLRDGKKKDHRVVKKITCVETASRGILKSGDN
jgi:hypothetical protein